VDAILAKTFKVIAAHVEETMGTEAHVANVEAEMVRLSGLSAPKPKN